MPEIAEGENVCSRGPLSFPPSLTDQRFPYISVARCVHFLQLHLVGKTIARVTAIDDANVFGKAGTSASEFEKAIRGKRVVSAGRQGKYFWITFDRPPHAVMHLGMTGWVHIKGDRTAYTNYYKKMKEGEADMWPPKYWKFQLETEGNPKVEVAYTDPRRFGRVRLVDCPGQDIRRHSPLKENGPDPVADLDVFTQGYLEKRMKSRHVPIKALLLDQSHISGIGNWVADEVLYQARVHPEQYCDDFGDDEIGRIYDSIRDVCQTAVDKLGDSDEFPDHWLFNHRWGKGGKNGGSSVHPNGEKLAFLTVGGRTSCYAPSRQKKTGRVVASVKEEPLEEASAAAPPKTKGKARKKAVEKEESDADEPPPAKKRRGGAKRADSAAASKEKSKVKTELDVVPESSSGGLDSGRRRSSRLRK
ncbi:hypothetical protein SODALDRAFT_335362 [Sodiomyces alkalinus F11]|uniref:Formamidopyrimidine-DNA glycosylase catalytic domain-containing protein n=1 Tax=Sodiomyces alkalinus (strain CBS 110278 / VKM F-3762 / F11) TaxID=1314773 RepID=A0A3N2PPB1_SODAK|nr:hypothetical protein SODALDRAFT_335362 [Sodiomyces alkalinus F11]ROT36280.1 hypothetical protein SODALDRAFT_335362 [Sodiomyces alkalinus F11]